MSESQLPLNQVLPGDCLEVLRTLPDNSVDAVVSDPPSGTGFMGKAWDADKGGRAEWIAWLAEVMCECRRVVKPGGHALVWALPRTSHWTATALEDAGWEIRDCVTHHFGSGFPKNLDVSKQIDKMAGAEREVTGSYQGATNIGRGSKYSYIVQELGGHRTTVSVTHPATPAPQAWQGWGTALKPATEFWWLCRKPLSEANVAGNVLRWSTGALNIDGTRIGTEQTRTSLKDLTPFHGNQWGKPGVKTTMTGYRANPPGRWPANLVLTHSLFCADSICAPDCPVAELDRQSGVRAGGRRPAHRGTSFLGKMAGNDDAPAVEYDSGGASRFFATFHYFPKASRAEREAGCEELPYHSAGEVTGRAEGSAGLDSPRAGASRTAGARNHHPTVKNLELMRWLCRLVTPPGGVILDPFAGSGSTLVACVQEGYRYIGIEREAEYVAIANARVRHAQRHTLARQAPTRKDGPSATQRRTRHRQVVAPVRQSLWDNEEVAI